MKNNTHTLKGAITMKKTLLVLALAAVLVFAFAATASAKYASYNASEAYLSWGGANNIYKAINGTTDDQVGSPHGGYTQTSVKCVVCHSTHRAFSTQNALGVAGVGTDTNLLNGTGGSCVACHAAWGSSPSAAVVEVGETYSGPHIGAGGSTCTNRGCHGSVHGAGPAIDYAIVNKYNLTNNDVTADVGGVDTVVGNLLITQMDEAIAAGNVNASITTTSVDKAMKAFATGYVCYPCHTNSSFSIAANGYANEISLAGVNEFRTGHPSAKPGNYSPSCESCHDMIGVATNSTAFPHANRGIDVFEGRFDHYNQVPVTGATISTTNDNATRYGLWMTSAEYTADHSSYATATPIVYAGDTGYDYNLQDGVCIKCHNPADMK